MSTAALTTPRTVAGHSLVFSWEGGAYIEIEFEDREGAFDVINVYDYKAGAPAIPFTWGAFDEAVDAYVNDPERDHAHDLANEERGWMP